MVEVRPERPAARSASERGGCRQGRTGRGRAQHARDTDIDVVQLTATVEGDSIKSYRAKVKVSHLVESRILSGLPR